MTTSGATRISWFAWSAISSRLRRLAHTLAAPIALLFPPECVQCGRSLGMRQVICSSCFAVLDNLTGPRCVVCGDEVEDDTIDLCLICGTRDRAFDRLTALGTYDGGWGALVRALKFEHEMAIGRWLSRRLAGQLQVEGIVQCVDWVSFVPMSGRERRRRGFNQSRLLARLVARQLGLPMKRTLRKTRRTELQARLSASKRRENLRGAYCAVPSLEGRILLVDDICTTGSTVDACSRTLKDAGCSSVSVLVIARA